MILTIQQNTPVSAPQITNMTTALDRYRSYIGEPLYSMSDFVAFITRPSVERDKFLRSEFTVSITTMNNKYVKQIYS